MLPLEPRRARARRRRRPERRGRAHARRRQRDGLPAVHGVAAGRPARRARRRRARRPRRRRAARATRIPVAGAPWLRRPTARAGVEVRFLAADGTVLGTEQRPGCAFVWMGSFGDGLAAATWRGSRCARVLRATEPGTYAVGGSGVGTLPAVGRRRRWCSTAGSGCRAGRTSSRADDPAAGRAPRSRSSAGEEVDVVLAHEVGSAASELGDVGTNFQLNLRPPHGTDDEEIERAVALARDADVAVVVVGTTEEVESEGFDRTSLALPGRQDELVRAWPRSTAGRWSSSTPARRCCCRGPTRSRPCCWRGFRARSSATRSPTCCSARSSPAGGCRRRGRASEEGLPSTQPVDGILAYEEGLRVGYRGRRRGRASRSVTGWASRRGSTSRSTRRRGRRPGADVDGRRHAAQHRRAARPRGGPGVRERPTSAVERPGPLARRASRRSRPTPARRSRSASASPRGRSSTGTAGAPAGSPSPARSGSPPGRRRRRCRSARQITVG